jgi:outer membrane protein assembly factor BamB
MKHAARIALILFVAFAPVTAGGNLAEPDWPQWHGPDRNAISRETGLLKTWPAAGPPVVWSVGSLGEGYGSISIKGDRLFVQGVKDSRSVVFCLNRADGKTVWTTPLGQRLGQDRGPGPRGTPTTDGDRVYALSENGDLACEIS